MVYNAIDWDRFDGPVGNAPNSDIAELLIRPYLLSVCHQFPHKNLQTLLLAFEQLAARHPDLFLYMVGIDSASNREFIAARLSSAARNRVKLLGFLSDQNLGALYRDAQLFVLPSLYEGFGLPPLEAMAHGTPVVTSNTSSLPEVVGNAAVLVNPENVFEIMRALHRALVDQPLRDKLKARGYEQAKRFSWDASARQILRVYHEVADKQPVKTQFADERVTSRATNS